MYLATLLIGGLIVETKCFDAPNPAMRWLTNVICQDTLPKQGLAIVKRSDRIWSYACLSAGDHSEVTFYAWDVPMLFRPSFSAVA